MTEVQCRAGVYGYMTDNGWRELAPLSAVLEGWTPEAVVTQALAPLSAVVWRGPDAGFGLWYLDAEGHRLAGRLTELGGWERDHATQAIASLAWRDTASILFPYANAPREAAHAALIEDWLQAGGGGPHMSPAGAANHFAHLEATLDPSQSQFSIEGGDVVLTVIHPTTGHRIRLSNSLLLDDFRSLWPVPGATHLFLCRGGHKATFIGLYDARAGEMYVGPGDAVWLTPHLFATVAADLTAHARRYGDILAPYLARADHRLTAVFRDPPHLGHQLYNELGGLEELIGPRAGQSRPPAVMILGDEGAEVYGPTEALFPEMLGSVHHTPGDWRAEAYKRGFCGGRFTSEYVSAAMRARIICRATTSQDVRPDLEVIKDLKARNRPVIILGLRVENRTLTDLPGFLRSLATEIAGRWSNAVLVIDGHNARASGSPEVYANALACKRDPFEFEKEISADLRAHCRNLGLDLIDLIGAPMARSVLWSAQATAFVAPWGAGLAKYRWIGNCPGVVLSNSWNAVHRSDFHIYSDSSVMEAPSPVLTLDASLVRDDHDVENLLMSHPPDQPSEGALNFEVDVPDVIDLLSKLMPTNREARHVL